MIVTMDNILNVLIVEDEKPIRDDLALFPWSECGALLIGEAANGAEALEICRELTPDVIFTDITMPKMDGLSLMEQVNELYPGTAVIVLTCHEDFDYARKALRLGAIDYLTKIGMRDENIRQAFDKARSQVYIRKHFEQSRWREGYWERTAAFRAWREPTEGVLPAFIHFPCRLAAIQIVCKRVDTIFAGRQVLNHLEKSKSIEWLSAPGMRNLLFTDDSGISEEELQKLIFSLQEEIDHRLPYLAGEMRIIGSLSPRLQTEPELLEAMADLDCFRDQAFYEEQKTFFSGTPPKLSELDEHRYNALETRLRIAEQSPEQLIAFLKNELRIWCREQQPKPQQLQNILLSHRETWRKLFLNDTDNESIQMRLSGISRLSGLLELLYHEIEENTEERNRSLRPELTMAIKILRNTYADGPTLTDVAEQVGLSSAYLSRIFRSETGYTFKDYLTEIRIRKAMDLLKQPGIKVYTVAEAVGFPSYRYFSTIFKAMTGLRPKEYQGGGGIRKSN